MSLLVARATKGNIILPNSHLKEAQWPFRDSACVFLWVSPKAVCCQATIGWLLFTGLLPWLELPPLLPGLLATPEPGAAAVACRDCSLCRKQQARPRAWASPLCCKTHLCFLFRFLEDIVIQSPNGSMTACNPSDLGG